MKTIFFVLFFLIGLRQIRCDVCTMTADGMIQNQLNCYAVITTSNAQNTSEEICQSANGHLVFLETIEEQEWLHQELSNLGMPTTYWTGANEMTADLWYWRSTPINYFQIDLNRIHNYQTATGNTKAIAVPGPSLEQSFQMNSYPYICEKDTTGVFYPPPQIADATNQPLSTTNQHSTPVATTNQQSTPLSTTDQQSAPPLTTNYQSTLLSTTNQQSTSLSTTNQPSTQISSTSKQSTLPSTTNQPSTSLSTTNQPSTPLSATNGTPAISAPLSVSDRNSLYGKFVGISIHKATTASIKTPFITMCARRCLEIHCSLFCYFPINQLCLRFVDNSTIGSNITCSSASACYGV